MSSYADQVKALAESIGSDGCSPPASQLFVTCCHVHDIGYRLGTDPRGARVSKAQVDQRFRDCIQRHSSFGWLSPLAAWRWLAVSWFGRYRPVLSPIRPQPFLGIRGLGLAQARHTQDVLAEAREARRRILDEELAK